jgi:hypothetical protein
MFFLDAEAASMSFDTILLESTEHRINFRHHQYKTLVLTSDISISNFDIKAGKVLIWSFKTQKHPVNFYLEVNGKLFIPSLTYDSHVSTILGEVEFDEPATCTLTISVASSGFFSFFGRTDVLNYMVVLAEPDDYEAVYGRKQRYVQLRDRLRLSAQQAISK